MNIRDVFASRWKFGDNPRLSPIRAAMLRTLDLHESIRAEHGKLTADRGLTKLGAQNAFRTHLAANVAPELARSQRAVALLKEKVAAWHERLRPAKPGKDDTPAAIQLRSETRAIVRAMKPGERHTALLAKEPNELLIAAVLEGENFHSGIEDDVREKIVAAAIERMHPDQLRKIRETEAALEMLTAATDMAASAARAGADFPIGSVLDSFIADATKEKAAAIAGQVAQELRVVDAE